MPGETKKYGLEKNERLFHTKEIDRLFDTGKAFLAFPLRIVYDCEPATSETESPAVAILTSVSKKKFKKAVDRNRIKRLIKEAYRLNKHLLLSHPEWKSKRIRISFTYIHKEILGYEEIEKSIRKALELLQQNLS